MERRIAERKEELSQVVDDRPCSFKQMLAQWVLKILEKVA
jgi:hypothetical protein